jgi:beta-N-acetylhexosaminidase
MSPSALRRQIGQLVCLGFQGHTIPPETRSLARDFDVGGVILFARNVDGPEQVAELSFEAERLVDATPLWVAADQEGGRVARMRRPFTEWPPMAALGRSGDAGLAARFAASLGRELKSVGVTLDCAPVLDVLTNPKNPAIGDRALADDADAVARFGVAIIRSLQAEGVAACGKHFPGHGDTTVDSHHDLPVVALPPDRFHAVEFVPFRAAIAEDVAAIMVGHVLAPAFDEDWPASLSRTIVTGLLRDTLAFENLILTDDVGMKACSGRLDAPAATVRAVAAGHDAVLLCEPNYDNQSAALEALARALEDGSLPYAQVEASVARHARLKSRYLRPRDRAARPASGWREIVGCEAHQLIADEMRRYA